VRRQLRRQVITHYVWRVEGFDFLVHTHDKNRREESKSIRGGGTGREEARRAVRAEEARARTSSGSPASAIAALALVRGWSRGGSTCACALGCGAGEQPEEYRIFSRKTKLSHHASVARFCFCRLITDSALRHDGDYERVPRRRDPKSSGHR
jgi:hypothetical protein